MRLVANTGIGVEGNGGIDQGGVFVSKPPRTSHFAVSQAPATIAAETGQWLVKELATDHVPDESRNGNGRKTDRDVENGLDPRWQYWMTEMVRRNQGRVSEKAKQQPKAGPKL